MTMQTNEAVIAEALKRLGWTASAKALPILQCVQPVVLVGEASTSPAGNPPIAIANGTIGSAIPGGPLPDMTRPGWTCNWQRNILTGAVGADTVTDTLTVPAGEWWHLLCSFAAFIQLTAANREFHHKLIINPLGPLATAYGGGKYDLVSHGLNALGSGVLSKTFFYGGFRDTTDNPWVGGDPEGPDPAFSASSLVKANFMHDCWMAPGATVTIETVMTGGGNIDACLHWLWFNVHYL